MNNQVFMENDDFDLDLRVNSATGIEPTLETGNACTETLTILPTCGCPSDACPSKKCWTAYGTFCYSAQC